MLELELHPDEHYAALRASGTLTREDYDRAIPRLESAMEESAPMNLFVELDNFRGWEPGAMSSDIDFDIVHRSRIDRMAVVGDNRLTQWSTAMGTVIFPVEIRYFSQDERSRARRWVRSGSATVPDFWARRSVREKEKEKKRGS